MNCPRCGKPVEHHNFDLAFCNCPLTELQATLAAQRQAAARTLREFDHRLWAAWRRMVAGYSTTEYEKLEDRVIGYRQALRDLGISRPLGGKE